jgi:hypothetical protein
MNKFAFLFILVILMGCAEKADVSIDNSDNEIKRELESEIKPVLIEHGVDNYYGIINSDNVRLRFGPNLESEVLAVMKKGERVEIQARNDTKQKINGTDFYWFKIKYQDALGWVYGEYVNFFNFNEDGILEKNKEVLSGHYWNISVGDSEDNKFVGFVNYYTINEDAHIGDIFIYQEHIILQEFFSSGNDWYSGGITVYEYDENIDYCDYKILGKQVLKTSGPDSFNGIQDGLLFIDSGTGNGVRNIGVWDVANGIKIFSGSHFGGINYHNGEIEEVYSYALGRGRTNNLDEEIKTYAEEFVKNNAVPANEHGAYIELIITCDYNLHTGERNFTGCKYIFVE